MDIEQSISSFDEMAADLLSYLSRLGYAKTTISRYSCCINRIKTHMEQEGKEILVQKHVPVL